MSSLQRYLCAGYSSRGRTLRVSAHANFELDDPAKPVSRLNSPSDSQAYIQQDIPKLDRPISGASSHLVFVNFRPGKIVQSILSIEAVTTFSITRYSLKYATDRLSGSPLCFLSRVEMWRRPLPTRPKLAEEATARVEGKKGE